MENEIWKDVKNYPDYQVSNMGRVKSLKNGKVKILKQGIDKDGYYCVVLYEEKKRKTCKVHRLVCTAFIPNPQNLPCVNHKDENKQNNCVSNLEWCAQDYNINYGTRNERASKKLKGRVFSREWKDKIGKGHQKPILQFNREGTKILGKWDSALQVERELNIFATNITRCLKGKYKTCGGFKWLYLQDYVNRMNKLYNILKKAG